MLINHDAIRAYRRPQHCNWPLSKRLRSRLDINPAPQLKLAWTYPATLNRVSFTVLNGSCLPYTSQNYGTSFKALLEFGPHGERVPSFIGRIPAANAPALQQHWLPEEEKQTDCRMVTLSCFSLLLYQAADILSSEGCRGAYRTQETLVVCAASVRGC